MKYSIFTICCAVFLIACRDLAFTEPQPAGIANEYTFPETLQGVFVSRYNKDTLHITSNTFGDNADERLGPDTFIRKTGKYLILNNRDSLHWHLTIIKPRGRNSFTLYGFDMGDQKKRKKISDLLALQEIKDQNGKVEYYLAHPSEEEFEKLLCSRYWSRLETFKRIQ